jgi:hypothetical protein
MSVETELAENPVSFEQPCTLALQAIGTHTESSARQWMSFRFEAGNIIGASATYMVAAIVNDLRF